MDLAELLAELLRLMSAHPPTVEVNGPSDAGQVAQIAAPLVASGAVVLTYWGLKRSGDQHDRSLKAAEEQHSRSMEAAEEQHEKALTAANQARFRETSGIALAETAEALQVFLAALNEHQLWAWRMFNNAAQRARHERGEITYRPILDTQHEEILGVKAQVVSAKEGARLKTNRVQLYFPITTAVGAAAGSAYASGTIALKALYDNPHGAPQRDEEFVVAAIQSAKSDVYKFMRTIGEFARGEIEPATPAPVSARGDLRDWWAGDD